MRKDGGMALQLGHGRGGEAQARRGNSGMKEMIFSQHLKYGVVKSDDDLWFLSEISW